MNFVAELANWSPPFPRAHQAIRYFLTVFFRARGIAELTLLPALSARTTPMRANIVGPSSSTTSINASIAACHSVSSGSSLGISVMKSAASRNVTRLRPFGNAIGSSNSRLQPICALASPRPGNIQPQRAGPLSELIDGKRRSVAVSQFPAGSFVPRVGS